MKKSKSRIILSSVFFIVLLLIVGSAIIIPKIVEKKLDGLTFNGITLEIEKTSFSLINHSLKLSGVQVNDSLGKFSAKIEQINCTGINFASLILNKIFKAGSLMIDSPEIVISNNYTRDSTNRSKNMADIKFKALINKVEIENSSFAFVDSTLQNDSILFAIINLDIDDFGFLPDNANYTYKQFGANDLSANLSDFQYYTKDGFYRIGMKSMNFSTEKKELISRELFMETLMGKYELGRYRGVQSNWFDVNLKKLNLKAIDLNKLITDGQVRIKKMELDSADMKAFRDKRLPMPAKPDTKLPGDLIAAIPFPLFCDTLLLSHTDIRYSERAEESSETGHVDFIGLNAVGYSFTNIDSLLKKPVSLDVKARLFDQAILTAQLQFASNKFPKANHATGHLERIPFKAFNVMFKPVFSAKFDEGTIHQINFDFGYNNNISDGTLIMYYDNLKVNILDREDQDSKKLKSIVVNTFVVREDNYPGDRRYREGTISFERDKKRSIFHYWWKSISEWN